MEVWDAYYEDGTKAGIDLVRGQPIPQGLVHLVVSVLIKHVDGDYLLMQRAFDKVGHPGKYEASAGGSCLKGETPQKAVHREVFEETGITLETLTLYQKELQGQCIYYSFIARVDCDKDAVVYQTGETIHHKWVSKQELLDFLNSDSCIKSQGIELLEYFKTLKENENDND